eukprot:762714-Hanusia_phi.AAC.6
MSLPLCRRRQLSPFLLVMSTLGHLLRMRRLRMILESNTLTVSSASKSTSSSSPSSSSSSSPSYSSSSSFPSYSSPSSCYCFFCTSSPTPMPSSYSPHFLANPPWPPLQFPTRLMPQFSCSCCTSSQSPSLASSEPSAPFFSSAYYTPFSSSLFLARNFSAPPLPPIALILLARTCHAAEELQLGVREPVVTVAEASQHLVRVHVEEGGDAGANLEEEEWGGGGIRGGKSADVDNNSSLVNLQLRSNHGVGIQLHNPIPAALSLNDRYSFYHHLCVELFQNSSPQQEQQQGQHDHTDSSPQVSIR